MFESLFHNRCLTIYHKKVQFILLPAAMTSPHYFHSLLLQSCNDYHLILSSACRCLSSSTEFKSLKGRDCFIRGKPCMRDK